MEIRILLVFNSIVNSNNKNKFSWKEKRGFITSH